MVKKTRDYTYLREKFSKIGTNFDYLTFDSLDTLNLALRRAKGGAGIGYLAEKLVLFRKHSNDVINDILVIAIREKKMTREQADEIAELVNEQKLFWR